MMMVLVADLAMEMMTMVRAVSRSWMVLLGPDASKMGPDGIGCFGSKVKVDILLLCTLQYPEHI